MIEANINRDTNSRMFEASKIAQAIWGDRNFKNTPDRVNITDGILNDIDYEYERKKKINKTLKRIQEQYGIDLRR